MKRTFALLLFVATSALAQTPAREIFPSDYKPSPCAPTAASLSDSFTRNDIASQAASFRGYTLERDWVNAHWDEMVKGFEPVLAKAASCLTVVGNDNVYCFDLIKDEFLATCDRYPEGSVDREQCTMFAVTYYIGIGIKTKEYREAQACTAAQAQTASALRKMDAWMTPEMIGPGYRGTISVHAIDAETHLPLRARITYKGAGELGVTDAGPDATAFYPLEWKPTLTRVRNTSGHDTLIAPTMTLNFPGYEPVTLTLPVAAGKMLVEMHPAASKLKRGKNAVTITARDAATGEPVEARVMAGDRVLGEANQPLELVVERGRKLPEIWVTNLFDRYDDVVVVPAKK